MGSSPVARAFRKRCLGGRNVDQKKHFTRTDKNFQGVSPPAGSEIIFDI